MIASLPNLPTILAQARAGDRLAIQALYAHYGAAVQRYCYARLGTQEAAEDCTQEVFVRVWKHVPTFEYRGDPSFISWVYTIANHVVISYLRKWQRIEHMALTADLDYAADHRSDPARIVCDQVTLADAIDQLTLEQQQVITLKFFGGLSNLEIATALGRTEGAVKALQHRALQRLQRLLVAEPATPLCLDEAT